MFNRIISRLTDFYWFRLLTDRRCTCVRCGEVVGYVVVNGHSKWECGACTGTGDARAVGLA